MAAVVARDKKCQFFVRLAGAPPLLPSAGKVPSCGGRLDVHEPGHRSQGADPTDPAQCVLVCRLHHDYVHNWPLLASAIGL